MRTIAVGATRWRLAEVTLVLATLILTLWGCAEMPREKSTPKAAGTLYPAGTVISTGTDGPISVDALMDDLAKVSVRSRGKTP